MVERNIIRKNKVGRMYTLGEIGKEEYVIGKYFFIFVSIIHTHTHRYILFCILFCYSLSQGIEYSSLCYI